MVKIVPEVLQEPKPKRIPAGSNAAVSLVRKNNINNEINLVNDFVI
jgi:hypothetical protein